MKTLEQIYNELCKQQSDINEHLPTLKKYAEECNHITEFGVRRVVSTYAFMMGKPKRMISYDIIPIERYGVYRIALKQLAQTNGIDFDFHVGDTAEITIDNTDLLFIDTYHSYKQLRIELALHASKAQKYIILHDTVLFGDVDESGSGIGLNPAIDEFLISNTEWKVLERHENNNGLTILARK